MVYFAYGSNMLQERLVARVGEVRRLGCTYLSRYRLTFNKRGRDGSGKCTIVDTGDAGDGAWGALFELSFEQKLTLDRFEGRGYQAQEVVTTQNDLVVDAFTYISLYEWTDEFCRPSAWYKALVLAGALQSKLPRAYLADIEQVLCVEDPDRGRAQHHKDLIRESGYGQIVTETDGCG